MAASSRTLADDVCRLVTEHLPNFSVESIAIIGEGWDNTAYELNGELILRVSKETDPVERAVSMQREAAVLSLVRGISGLAVPEPVFVDARRGAMAYFKVPGVPLNEIPKAERAGRLEGLAGELGELLAALHATPPDRLAGVVPVDVQPLAQWRDEAAGLYRSLFTRVPAQLRAAIETFFASALPAGDFKPVFSHNDLGIEHVLVDRARWRVSGIIDWADAAIVDPAYDFGLLYRDLGPGALDAALRAYRVTDDQRALRERAVFYARCSPFEDLAYGVETERNGYVEGSLTAIARLYRPG